MEQKQYDIFISYRRESGAVLARLLKYLWRKRRKYMRGNGADMARTLKAELMHQYKVFLDYDELGHIGTFDNRILEAIETTRVFLFMYTPGCLDGCSNADDWVAKEIRHAIKSGCIIVPLDIDLTLSSYEFPDNTPEDIKKGLGQYQFIVILMGILYQASIDNLMEELESIFDNQVKKEEPEEVHSINSHEYVDLGVSVKWATCNVGAVKPEEYGDYFAWGETEPKEEYTEENSIFYGDKTIGNIAGNVQYDAARANWGSSWRLPTIDEMKELLENCKHKWVKQNGVEGRLFTSKKNGKSIFLPAAGFRYGSSLNFAGEYGNYWGATPTESGSYSACYLYFSSGDAYWYWRNRGYGCSVRPVTE